MSARVVVVDNVELLDGRLLGDAEVTILEPDPQRGPGDWRGEIALRCDAEVVAELRRAHLAGTSMRTSIGDIRITGVSASHCEFKGNHEPRGPLASLPPDDGW